MYDNIYRVIDTCVDTKRNICAIYTRDSLCRRYTIFTDPAYEIIMGTSSNEQMRMLTTIMETLANSYPVSISLLGSYNTYYRGQRILMLITCGTYTIYSTLMNKIRYNYDSCFLCESFSTVENKTLNKHGIYGATHVYYDGHLLRPATKEECFDYTPKVAGIDLEMLSLNPVDPSCVLYMASYYSESTTVVIYTSDYCCDIESSDIIYIRVVDKHELVKKLSDVIAYEAPDIITGYNIYIADMPLLYFTLGLSMSKWTKMCDGPDPYFQYTRRLDRGFADSDSGTVIKIPGCHVIDMYFHLDHTLPSEQKNNLKLDDVSFRYIGANKDPFTYRDLARIYHNGTYDEKKLVMTYCIKDSYLSVQLYLKFNVWNYHSSMYSISGIDPQRASCTGAVDVTYGMCYIRSKSMKVFLDQPVNKIFSPSGGLVLTSHKGIFVDVHCIDFSALYPNITIEHNIDSLSIVNHKEHDIVAEHGPVDKELYYAISRDRHIVGLNNSTGRMVFFDLTVPTILPSALTDLLHERERLKEQLKSPDLDVVEKLSLSGQEQARKIGANGACGSLAEPTPGNPMSYCELNDVITTTGRTILKLSHDVARDHKLLVIYGDTDSLILKTDEDINKYLDTIHELLPKRIRFKVEYIADKFIMGMKKHYVAKIGSTIKIMGYKAVKSSSCKAAQMMFRWLIDKLLEHGPDVTMCHYNNMIDYYSSTDYDIDIELFTCRFSYNGKAYAQGTYRQKVITAMTNRGVELVAGNTLSVVTVKSTERYSYSYNNSTPPIQLPVESEGKSSRLYTVEEVGTYNDVIDVREILDTQCGSDIRNIISCMNTITIV
jgi:DNA polymerase elongation subunit (family B)